MVVPVMVSVVTVMMSIVMSIVVTIMMSVALTWFVRHGLGRPWFWRTVANGRPWTRSWFGSSHARFRRGDSAIAWFAVSNTRIERLGERLGFHCVITRKRFPGRTGKSIARLLVVESGVNLFHRSAWLQRSTLMLHFGKRVLFHPCICDTTIEALWSLHR